MIVSYLLTQALGYFYQNDTKTIYGTNKRIIFVNWDIFVIKN